MGESAIRKRAALRRLHEHWNVPLALIAEAGNLALRSVECLSIKEGWKQAHGTGSMQAKLIEVFEAHLVRYSSQEEEESEEKRARALSILAKAMESMAVVDVKLSTVQPKTYSGDKKQQDKETQNEQSFQFDAERTAHLDQQLAELVQSLS